MLSGTSLTRVQRCWTRWRMPALHGVNSPARRGIRLSPSMSYGANIVTKRKENRIASKHFQPVTPGMVALLRLYLDKNRMSLTEMSNRIRVSYSTLWRMSRRELPRIKRTSWAVIAPVISPGWIPEHDDEPYTEVSIPFTSLAQNCRHYQMAIFSSDWGGYDDGAGVCRAEGAPRSCCSVRCPVINGLV